MTVKKILSILLALTLALGTFTSVSVNAGAADETGLSGGDSSLASEAGVISFITNRFSQTSGLSGGDGNSADEAGVISLITNRLSQTTGLSGGDSSLADEAGVISFITNRLGETTGISGGDGNTADEANVTSYIVNSLSQTVSLSGGDGDTAFEAGVSSYIVNEYAVEYTVTPNPTEGGTISGGGLYVYGSTATVTATPNEHYNFVSWTENGNVVSMDAEYTSDATADRSLVANFEPQTHGINVSVNPAENGTVSGGGTYSYGSTATVTASPATGYSFINWTENDEEVSTEATYSFTVDGDRNLVANFELQTHGITVTANPTEGGTVSGDGTYDYGSTVTVNASPATGYSFINWTENGEEVSTEATYSFTVESDCNLVANFELNTHSISVSANPTQGGTVTGGGSYDYGSTATVTASPNGHYNFVNWTENGEEVSANANYSFTVEGDRNLVANFELQTHGITVTANPTEGGTVSGVETFSYGSTVTVTATPNEHYNFVNWTENGEEVSANANYSFTVEGDRSLVANFELQKHSITVVANPTEGGNVSGGETYEYGNTATVTASPATGYSFINWTENGEEVSTDSTYSFTVTDDRNLVANFGLNTHSISVSANPTQGGTVTGGGTYSYGSTATVTAMPNEHYNFVNWTENGEEVSANANYSFTVTGDRNLVAIFEKETFTISFVNEDGTELQRGSVPYGETPVYTGETPVKQSTAEYTYTFAAWSPEVTEVTDNATYTATYNLTPVDYTIKWVIDGDEYSSEILPFGSDVTAPDVAEKTGYTFAWVNEIPGTMPAQDVTINGKYTAIEYTATFVDENGETVDEIKYTVETQSITPPSVPEKKGYLGKWEDYTLTIGGITVKPVYTNISGITLNKDGIKDTVDYKEDQTFTVAAKDLPEGSGIHWFVNGKDVGTGKSYTVEDPTEDYTVQAKVIDKDGNVLAKSEILKVHVKNGFFDRLKAFFTELIEKALGKAITDFFSSIC